jgi:hypothetical protein
MHNFTIVALVLVSAVAILVVAYTWKNNVFVEEKYVDVKKPEFNRATAALVIDAFKGALGRKPTKSEADFYREEIDAGRMTKEDVIGLLKITTTLMVGRESFDDDVATGDIDTKHVPLATANTLATSAYATSAYATLPNDKGSRNDKVHTGIVSTYLQTISRLPTDEELDTYYTAINEGRMDISDLKERLHNVNEEEEEEFADETEGADDTVEEEEGEDARGEEFVDDDTIQEEEEEEEFVDDDTIQEEEFVVSETFTDERGNATHRENNRVYLTYISIFGCPPDEDTLKYLESLDDGVRDMHHIIRQMHDATYEENVDELYTELASSQWNAKKRPIKQQCHVNNKFAQSALIGTPIEDARMTKIGWIMPKFVYYEK